MAAKQRCLQGLGALAGLLTLVSGCGRDSDVTIQTGRAQADIASSVPAERAVPLSSGSTVPVAQACESYEGGDFENDFSFLQFTLGQLVGEADVVLTGEFTGAPQTFFYEMAGPPLTVPAGMTTTYNPALPPPGPLGHPVTEYVFKVDQVMAIKKVLQDITGSASPDTFTVRFYGEHLRRCFRADPRPVVGVKYLLFGSLSDAMEAEGEYKEHEKYKYGQGGAVILPTFASSMIARYVIGPDGEYVPEPAREGIPASVLDAAEVRRAVSAAGREGLESELQRSFRR